MFLHNKYSGGFSAAFQQIRKPMQTNIENEYVHFHRGGYANFNRGCQWVQRCQFESRIQNDITGIWIRPKRKKMVLTQPYKITGSLNKNYGHIL